MVNSIVEDFFFVCFVFPFWKWLFQEFKLQDPSNCVFACWDKDKRERQALVSALVSWDPNYVKLELKILRDTKRAGRATSCWGGRMCRMSDTGTAVSVLSKCTFYSTITRVCKWYFQYLYVLECSSANQCQHSHGQLCWGTF